MKSFCIFLLVFFFALPTYGQREYYKTESKELTIGTSLINTGKLNTYYCSVKKNDSIIKYTPYEVREFGFENGAAYVAFDVLIDNKKE
jgi:hypothetical protein